MLLMPMIKISTICREHGLQRGGLSIPNRQSLIPFCMMVGACLIGCASPTQPIPTTYPVHGRVTYEDGTPVTDGLVQFHPDASLSVATTGKIQSDGTYSLTTMRDGLRAEGALPGPKSRDRARGERERRKQTRSAASAGTSFFHDLSHPLHRRTER